MIMCSCVWVCGFEYIQRMEEDGGWPAPCSLPFSLETGVFIELEVRLVASKLALTVLLCPIPKLWSYWYHLTLPVLLVIYTLTLY